MEARGWVARSGSLDTIPLPDELFAPGEPNVLAVIVPYRPAGEAWWTWTLIMVTVGPAR
jgi:hypothetical protein